MTLFLDHQQRLNLISLLGMERGTVAEIRLIFGLQDRLGLDEQEKEEIDYQIVVGEQGESARWDNRKSLPVREIDVSEGDCQRIRKVLESFPNFQPGDCRWVIPLLDQLPVKSVSPTEVVASNGR
jgi:hypothetical protein